LAELANEYSIAIPKTIVTTVGRIEELAAREFGFPQRPVYLKVDGLGGGFNVRAITRPEEVAVAIEDYSASQPRVIQQAIDESYAETIHIYTVSDSAIEYQGSRMKITVDDQWYGNIFLPGLRLTEQQRKVVDNAARAARGTGYSSPEPRLIGFDGFLNKEELFIIECNARWLGSSPAEYIMKRLGIFNKVMAMSVFDYIAETEMADFMAWTERNLFDPDKHEQQEFSILPMGFSGYQEADGTRIANIIIFGNVPACGQDIRKSFSKQSFTLLDNSISTLDAVMRKGVAG
jgi:hypothetical protein